MDHKFKEDRKTVTTLKNSSISPKKNISSTYHIYRLFARGRATSKHGGGARYDAAIFIVQRGVIRKKESSKGVQIKNQSSDVKVS
jgi:hypothetical protein